MIFPPPDQTPRIVVEVVAIILFVATVALYAAVFARALPPDCSPA